MILKDLMDETGKLQKEPVMKLRKTMAHELGHIVLHTEILAEAKPLDGYREQLKKLDWEADVFGEELLRLYKENDHRVDFSND
jgi:Zn-dependent peptidase ImmA (M78 family)